MLQTIARVIVSLWFRTSSDSWRSLPRPVDAPVVHTPGVTPDRILIIGAGPVVGYGAMLHELTISGAIARQVTRLTGRGMDADIVASPRLDVPAAVIALADVRIARYDAVVLMLGAVEVFNLIPLQQWRRNLTGLLEWLEAEGPASLQVIVVGVPPIDRIVRLPFRGLFVKHGLSIDRLTKSVVEGRKNVEFVALDVDVDDLVGEAGQDLIVEGAACIAPVLAAALSTDAPIRAEAVDEGARVAALRDLRVLDSASDANIQEVVDTVLSSFGVVGASFSLIDRDRHWVKAGSGMLQGSVQMERSTSFCAITIEQSRMFVIEDMSTDPLYSDKPFVTGPPMLRFYAGYPVEAPNGQRVGSLCIMDTKPRALSAAEATLLREFALRIQRMVWDRVNAPPMIPLR